ncbi:hypothetical protein Tco_0728769 [Tanacetum coccineum]|uniref:Reverse transcriptase domain-containing protein n=1 Tax=Tanacetum coccineum TaxID=301880 RepID=A0ABQ4YQ76_9ASTR
MDAPPSPNHVFNFPEEEFEEDPQEEPEEEFEEDPEEELEAEAEEDAPPAVTPPVGSPITPPPLSKSSSNTEAAAPEVANGPLEMPLAGRTFEVGGPSSVSPFPPFYLHGREIVRLDDNTELLFRNVKYLERFHGGVEGRVTKLEDKDQEKTEEMEKMKKRLETLETNYALVLSSIMIGRNSVIPLQSSKRELHTVLIINSWTMSPRRLRGAVAPRRSRRAVMEQLIADRVAKAIAEHERNRSNPDNAKGSMNVQGCSHKTFMNGMPYSFNGTKGVVGLRRWIEKVEQVFGISKCVEQDKIMFVASTFEGRELTW